VLVAGALLVVAGAAGFDGTVRAVSIVLEIVFVAFFARHLAFAVAALRFAPTDLDADVDVASATHDLPTVSVLVACLNEEAVVGSLIKAFQALDYPSHLIEFLIVDDGSTDATGAMLDRLSSDDGRITCLHRAAGSGGGKSGALNEALIHARGEIIVVFDADHRPRPDVVRRLVRHFRDPNVAAAQGRCVIRNRADSLLARLVWVDYLAGYLVNEYGRQALFQLPAYGGANCAVRAANLRAAGGWNTDSVTEDTDLTLRLMLGGRRVRYDVTAVDEEEGVVSLDRFWRQRYRWARGHQQAWRDYRRAVWRSERFTLGEKVELTMFLLVFHLPVASALGLLIFLMWMTGLARPFGDVNTFIFWTLLFLGPLLELGGGLLLSRSPRSSARLLVYFLPVFFVSIALCTKAWLDTARRRRYSWVKTERAGAIAL